MSPILIFVIIVLINFNSNLMACVQCKQLNVDINATKSWSVELSSVTTLPPPSKMLAAISSSLGGGQQHKHKPINQDNLFDDAPQTSSDLSTTFARPYDQADHHNAGQLTPSYLTGPLDGQPQTRNLLINQAADDLNKWTPTYHYVAPSKAPEPSALYAMDSPTRQADNILPPVDHRPISAASGGLSPSFSYQQEPNYITLDTIARHFRPQQPQARQWNTPLQLPGETLVSQDLLRKALAIRDALRHQKQPLMAQSGESGGQDRELDGIQRMTSKRKSMQPKSKSRSSYDQDHQQQQQQQLIVWPAAIRKDDLMGNEHLAAPHLLIEPPLEALARNKYNQAQSALDAGPRNSKLDYETSASQLPYQEKLSPSASHYRYHHESIAAPAVYFASAYPLAPVAHYANLQHHHHKGVMRHDKASLLKPVLIGILAALVSFLVISNLFLSIPLFAMTLFQLISGAANMMMLPNGNMMPAPNNQQQQQPSNLQPNNQQMANGRRKRRRRDIWVAQQDPHEGARLSSIAMEAILNCELV